MEFLRGIMNRGQAASEVEPGGIERVEETRPGTLERASLRMAETTSTAVRGHPRQDLGEERHFDQLSPVIPAVSDRLFRICLLRGTLEMATATGLKAVITMVHQDTFHIKLVIMQDYRHISAMRN